ncbi:hypothetical protein B0A53_01795 [Rhodotorula sp. CCFEE 5036]|nr:hypothetical protein B0A53_01795 [Rhodotorula sp. CCFEE 5036]
MRPKLPPLASLALPGALSSPATPALSFSTSSPPSSSSPDESPNGPPRRRHHGDDLDGDKAHVQAAIYEALRRRWSASSASELQTLAAAAAEALRWKQQRQQAYGVLDPAADEAAAASPAWAALRANKRNSDALQLDSEAHHLVTPSRGSGLVIPHHEEDEEARDQVSPLPSSSKRRRSSSIFAPPPSMTFPSPRAMIAHRSAILRASRQQIRTLSLDAGTAEKAELSRSQIPNRHSAFDNLLTSLAAVKTARASLSSPFSPPPLRYV